MQEFIYIFFFSFLVALTGALSPGPVLTFTIYKSLKSEKGYLAGFFIILGHAVLEFCLILLLLMGLYLLFQNSLFLLVIGIVGGILLGIYGGMVIRDAANKSLEIDFQNIDEENIKGYKGNNFIGGIILSLSNPFWIFWWAVIGLSFMINFGITLNEPVGLLFFFLGHELGDFIWYVPISIFVYKGGRSLNPKIYKAALYLCGLFMIGFGCYLAINVLLFPPSL